MPHLFFFRPPCISTQDVETTDLLRCRVETLDRRRSSWNGWRRLISWHWWNGNILATRWRRRWRLCTRKKRAGSGAISRGNAVPIVEKLSECMVTAFLLSKCLRTQKWTALRTIFRPKCSGLQDFAYTVSQFFRG